MDRRQFMFSATSAAVLQAQADEPQTVVYKTAGGCDIKADIWGVSPNGQKPVAVWIHGGALISGSRKLSPNGG